MIEANQSWNVGESVPDRLPLLDLFIDTFFLKATPLEGFGALLVQHQMGTIVPMVQALFALGLNERSVWWVDIPYSSNTRVRNHLIRAGIAASHFFPGSYSLETPYGPSQIARVAAGLRLIDKSLRPTTPLLVLDDGGYTLQALAERTVSLARPVRIVEQTTRGVMHVRENEEVGNLTASVPVVNVAESLPKRILEGPCIGRSVWESLNRKLTLPSSASPRSQVLVLGLGTVGLAVIRALVRVAGLTPSSIWAVDHAAEPRASARALGVEVSESVPESDRFKDDGFDLVIGCSGHSSFSPQDAHVLAKEATLVSASSGDEELSRNSFLAEAETIRVMRFLPLTGEESPHDDIVLSLNGKILTFLNSGFPINFDGRVNSVPPKYMQATRICMVAGAIQAATAKQAGLQSLSQRYSEWVLEHCPSSRHFVE